MKRRNTVENIKEKITWERLSEIATQALHGLIEDDYETAMEYFRDTIDLTEEEREYFGVPTESEPHEFTCSDCPYHYADDYEDYPSCHYNGDDGYAPCSYEEPEEVDWSEFEQKGDIKMYKPNNITKQQAQEFYRGLCETVYGNPNKNSQGIMNVLMIAYQMDISIERAEEYCNAMLRYGVTERQGGMIVV